MAATIKLNREQRDAIYGSWCWTSAGGVADLQAAIAAGLAAYRAGTVTR